MFRKLLLIGVFILSAMNLFSQKMLLSDKEELNIRNDDFMVIGQCRSLTAVYKNHTAIGEIIFYNKNFTKEKISTLSFLPDGMLKIYFSCSREKLTVFYVIKENKQYEVFASVLKEDYSWTEPVMLDQIPAGPYRNVNEYMFASSEDNSKTIFYNSFTENDKKMVHVLIVDQDLNKLGHAEEALIESDLSLTDESVLSDEGNAFIAINSSKSNKAGNELVLLQLSKGASALDYKRFDLKEYSVSDLHMMVDNANNNLILCSYFADGKYSSPRGLFLCNYSIQQASLNGSYFTPLTLQISSTRKDLKDLKIRNMYLTKSGHVEIATEKYTQTVRNITSPAPLMSSSYMMSNLPENTRTVHEYDYDEIVLFNLKPDGSLAWSQSILKDQSTYDDNGIFSSYGVLQHRLGNAYIFNDLNSKQSRLLAAYVSGNSELTVKELQTNNEVDDWNLMPRSAVQISSTEIVMPCVSKSYLCFLKISY